MFYKMKEQYISTIMPKKIHTLNVSIYGELYSSGMKNLNLVTVTPTPIPSIKIGLLFKKK